MFFSVIVGNIGFKAFENSGLVVIMMGELSRSNLNTVGSRISIFNQWDLAGAFFFVWKAAYDPGNSDAVWSSIIWAQNAYHDVSNELEISNVSILFLFCINVFALTCKPTSHMYSGFPAHETTYWLHQNLHSNTSLKSSLTRSPKLSI